MQGVLDTPMALDRIQDAAVADRAAVMPSEEIRVDQFGCLAVLDSSGVRRI